MNHRELTPGGSADGGQRQSSSLENMRTTMSSNN